MPAARSARRTPTGFLAEHGPNSFVTSAAGRGAAHASSTCTTTWSRPIRDANRRYVVRDGSLVPFPLTPPAMLGTRLFSLRAKLRVLLEPLVRRGADDGDESVASFVRRRLGREVLDYAVDPFISGIFAGDAETLSMAHAFPRVARAGAPHGSLSKGLMAQRREALRAATASSRPARRPTSPAADASVRPPRARG